MSIDNRTKLATAMLCWPLPNGDIAADMLLAAELAEPVVMQTPPTPSKCTSLVRGNSVKAATLALSTDDPALLEKLSRHSSWRVREAAASNPRLPQEARRRLEGLSATRGSEMYNAVLGGADIQYITEIFSDPRRLEELGWRLAKGDAVSNLITRSLNGEREPISHEDIIALMTADRTGMLATRIAQAVGYTWPSGIDPLEMARLAEQNGNEGESKFLRSFISCSPVLDRTVLEATNRLKVIAPQALGTEQDVGTSRSSLRATTVESACVLDFVETSALIASYIHQIAPSVAVLDRIVSLYGIEVAFSAYALAPSDSTSAWAVERAFERSADGVLEFTGKHPMLEGLLHWIPSDDIERVRAAVVAKNDWLVGKWLNGDFGDINPDLAGEIVVRFPGSISRTLRGIAAKPWGSAVMHALINDTDLDALFLSFSGYGESFSVGDLAHILQRVCDASMGDPSIFDKNWNSGVFSSRQFIEHFDSEALTTEQVLTWLRLARSADLTSNFIGGDLRRKMHDGELELLLAAPGKAFAHEGISRWLMSRSETLLAKIPVERFDALVDALGADFLSLANYNKKVFGKYLADRLDRTLANGDEWSTAFELLVKSTVPVGTALNGARLLRRRGNKT